jgi:DNA replication protein DnaC
LKSGEGYDLLRAIGCPERFARLAEDIDQGGAWVKDRMALDRQGARAVKEWTADWAKPLPVDGTWSLTLEGDRGSGKTATAARLVAKSAEAMAKAYGWHDVASRTLWVHGPTLARDAAAGEAFDRRQAWTRRIARLASVSLLVVDEIAAIGALRSDLATAGYSALVEVLLRRYDGLSRTICTTALPVEEMAKAQQLASVADRLTEGIVIKIAGKSQRAAK